MQKYPTTPKYDNIEYAVAVEMYISNTFTSK